MIKEGVPIVGTPILWLVETIYKAKKISFKEINPFYFEICN